MGDLLKPVKVKLGSGGTAKVQAGTLEVQLADGQGSVLIDVPPTPSEEQQNVVVELIEIWNKAKDLWERIGGDEGSRGGNGGNNDGGSGNEGGNGREDDSGAKPCSMTITVGPGGTFKHRGSITFACSGDDAPQ